MWELKSFLVNAPGSRVVSFHCLDFGQRVKFVGISAEPVVEYSALIKSLSPASITIPVGYIDDVFGYLPTKDMIKPGGYEAAGFLKEFSLSGPWTPNFEIECRNTLQKLLKYKSVEAAGL